MPIFCAALFLAHFETRTGKAAFYSTYAASLPLPIAADLEAQGKTLLFMELNQEVVGVFAAADTLRAEVPAALAEVRSLGICHIERVSE